MKITPGLLEKYYKNLCSPEEMQAVEEWQLNLEADLDVILPPGEDKENQKEQIWTPLSAMLAQENTGIATTSQTSIKRDFKTRWRIASCLFLMATAGLAYYGLKSQDNVFQATISYKSIRTAKGQKASLKLPDGSIVVLNSETELKYPEKFTTASRTVYLTGEAHFKISKDPDRPFSVYTPTTLTRVLGTAFNLKAYHHENVDLVVQEGRVRFGGIKDSLQHQEYTKNDAGTYAIDGKLNKTHHTDIDASAWTRNTIVFEGQTLSAIIPILERWYNVSIKIENSALYKERFTGEFDNPTLYFLLDRMGFVMKFNYTINHKIITIK